MGDEAGRGLGITTVGRRRSLDIIQNPFTSLLSPFSETCNAPNEGKRKGRGDPIIIYTCTHVCKKCWAPRHCWVPFVGFPGLQGRAAWPKVAPCS